MAPPKALTPVMPCHDLTFPASPPPSPQPLQVEKELAGITARLNNPNFVAKASPPVIEEARQQAADAAARLAEIEAKLLQVQQLGQR